MVKRGILTYHHVVNWGSVLQAVCLTKFLQKLYPQDTIEIIDYVPTTSQQYNQQRLYRDRKKFKISYREKVKKYDRKMRQCQEFLTKHALLSTTQTVSDDARQAQSFMEEQDYDTVFVGSDTVFQLGPNFGGKHIGAPQAPNAYFLPYPSSFRKIGFAVSSNPFHSSMLETLDQEAVSEALSGFEYIFYRDQVTHDALRLLDVNPDRLSYIPDPSLLVDFDLLCQDEVVNFDAERIAAVAIGNAHLADQVIGTLQKLNYHPINLLSGSGSNETFTTENIPSVEAFINLHKRFDLVITDRFHGSIIALVVGSCPVIGIEETARYPDPNSKVRDLYGRLGIDDMLIRYDQQSINEGFLLDCIEKWRWSKVDIMQSVISLRSTALDAVKLL